MKMQCGAFPTMADPDLQWICCSQGYRFLNNTFIIKELSMVCIQTSDYYTWHITSNINMDDVDFANPLTKATYEIQVGRHGLAWGDGNYFEHELFRRIYYILTVNNPIFVVDRRLQGWLQKQGFNDVMLLRHIPQHDLNAMPHLTCRQFTHTTGFTHCAQRRCFEILRHLAPVLQPHLNLDYFRYEDGKFKVASLVGRHLYSLNDGACSDIHREQLLALTSQDGNACGKLRLAWDNDEASESWQITTVMQHIGECSLNVPSDDAAGTASN